MYPLPDKEYTVMVVVPTYNQVNFIAQALQNIVDQVCDFSFVVLVLDDDSNDGTREIVQEFEGRYPNQIRGFYFEENQYSKGASTLTQIIPWIQYSKYIAVCEGDDYWIDPHKLKKQVDFLKSHDDFLLCFHSALEHWEDGGGPDSVLYPVEDREYLPSELFTEWKVATASVLISTKVFHSPKVYELFNNKELMYYDSAFFIYCSIVGKVWGMRETMSVYRRLKSGYSENLVTDLRSSYRIIEKYCSHIKEMKSLFSEHFNDDAVAFADDNFIMYSLRGAALAIKHRDCYSFMKFIVESSRCSLKKTIQFVKNSL